MRTHKAKIRLDEGLGDTETERFKLVEVYNPKRSKKGRFFFIIYSHLRILSFEFNSKKGQISVSKILNQKVEAELGLVYCAAQKQFLVPSENSLEIWDRTLSYQIYAIGLKNKIKGFLRVAQKDLIVLYDKYW